MPELKKTLVEHDENTADIARTGFVEIERSSGRVGILGLRSVGVTVEEPHGHERVEEIADAAWVQANLGAEFRAGDLAIAEFGEHIEVDGGQENFGRPEGEGRLEDRSRIG